MYLSFLLETAVHLCCTQRYGGSLYILLVISYLKEIGMSDLQRYLLSLSRTNEISIFFKLKIIYFLSSLLCKSNLWLLYGCKHRQTCRIILLNGYLKLRPLISVILCILWFWNQLLQPEESNGWFWNIWTRWIYRGDKWRCLYAARYCRLY